MSKTYIIGEAAKVSNVNAKMIRHYESIGLVTKPKRTESGYRLYDENDIHALQFIKRARLLGFPIKEIKKLLGLWKNKSRASKEVKKLATEHLNDLTHKIKQLQGMVDTLSELVEHCHGNERPTCPILQDLEKD